MWHIGYGHYRTVHAGQKITKEQADVLLNEDLIIIEKLVGSMVTVPLTDGQFSAMVMWVLDSGNTVVSESKALELLNRGWYDQMPAQMVKSVGGRCKRLASHLYSLWNSPDISQEERKYG